MKTKQFFLMAAALCASAVFTGCSSELAESVQTVAEPQDGYPISISATKAGSDDITRALSLNDETNTLSTSWSVGEKVYVYKNDDGEKVAELTPTSISGASCTLSGTISGTDYSTSDKLHLYYLKEKGVGYSGQHGTIADIAANFDFSKAIVDIEEVTANGVILSTGGATFERQQAITKFTLTLGDSYSAMVSPLKISATGLTDASAESPLTITPTVATNTIFAALRNTSNTEQTYTFVGTVGGLDWTGTKKVNLENNKYYLAGVKLYRDITETTGVTGINVIANNLKAGATLNGGNISVTDNGNPMTQGTDNDYTVVYKIGENVTTDPVVSGTTYTAVITGTGKYKGERTVTFSGTSLPDAVITLSTGDDYVADGQILAQGSNTMKVGATATYNDGSEDQNIPAGDITYTSSNSTGLTIGGDGTITANSAGTYTITITAEDADDTDEYNKTSITITVYVQQSGMGGTLPGTTTESSSWTDAE